MRYGQVIETDGDLARVTGRCVFSHKTYSTAWVEKGILKAGIDKWQGGAMIQNAMPFYSADDREFLISGISGDAFSKAIGGTR